MTEGMNSSTPVRGDGSRLLDAGCASMEILSIRFGFLFEITGLRFRSKESRGASSWPGLNALNQRESNNQSSPKCVSGQDYGSKPPSYGFVVNLKPPVSNGCCYQVLLNKRLPPVSRCL